MTKQHTVDKNWFLAGRGGETIYFHSHKPWMWATTEDDDEGNPVYPTPNMIDRSYANIELDKVAIPIPSGHSIYITEYKSKHIVNYTLLG